VNRHSPHARALALRRTASQLIFAWGSVVSVASYALLTVLGRPPVIDDHITVTAISMLSCYLLFRFWLDAWRYQAEARRRG
jgi:hypothetical protein